MMNNLDFKKLRTFRVAARFLHFSKTAAHLGYTQSAVTAQILALEEELEVPLFERKGRTVHLTEAGATLLSYADKLFSLRDEAFNCVAKTKEKGEAIKVSGHETVLSYRLPTLLNAYMSSNMHNNISIIPTPIDELKSNVVSGNLDVVFTLEGDFQDEKLNSTKLLREPVIVVASNQCPLTSKKVIETTDFEGQTLLLTDQSCAYRRKFESILKENDISTVEKLEFSNMELIKSCVKLNMGIAIVSEVSVKNELSRGELKQLNWKPSDEISVNLNMIWSRNRLLPKSVELFIDTIKEAAFV